MIHSLFLALLDLFFLGPKPTTRKPRFGTEKTAGLRPTDSVLQLCEAVVKEMGEKSGSVVSHSLIFQSQAAESVGGWGAFFLGREYGEVGRLEITKQIFKNRANMVSPRSVLGVNLRGELWKKIPSFCGRVTFFFNPSDSPGKFHDTDASKGWWLSQAAVWYVMRGISSSTQ